MKTSQTTFLFKADPDYLEKAQTILKKQIKEQRWALFYVQNDEVKLPAQESYLSSLEISELVSFGHRERLAQHLTSRWLLKNLLGALLKIPITEISTVQGPLGKPYLSEKQNSLQIDFNISHTKEITLVGISQEMQIGVDIEKIAEKKNSSAIAERFFQESESRWIAEGSNYQDRIKRFFRIWSMKEAVIKCRGGGVFQNIQQISFREELGSLILQGSTEPWSLTKNWKLFEFDEISEHACSIAIYKNVE